MKEEAVKQGLRKEWDVNRQRGSDRHCVCVWELLSLLFRPSNTCLPFYFPIPTRQRRGAANIQGAPTLCQEAFFTQRLLPYASFPTTLPRRHHDPLLWKRIPKLNETIQIENYTFKIMQAHNNRIDLVKLILVES